MAQLYFYYSAMNAGKSTSLLQSAYNYQERGMTVAIYTAALDNRFGLGKVSSRIGLAMDAHIFNAGFNFVSHVQQLKAQGTLDCVLIDEAQFFDAEITMVCETLASRGIRVIVAGLDMDYLGKPFGPMPQLLAIADFISKLHAICVQCGHLANVSYRTSEEQGTVVLGEKNNYEPRCRICAAK